MNKRVTRPRHRRRSGIMLVDLMSGFFLLAALSTALVIVQSARSRAAMRFADQRAATHLAERVLIELQSGLPVPKDLAEGQVEVQPLSAGSSPARRRWVQVRAAVNGQRVALCGLVPSDAPPAEVKP